MKRLAYLVAGLALFAAAAGATPAVAAYGAGGNCSTNAWMCTEVWKSIGPNYAYTGHDEPAVLFYSNQKSSGNSTDYTFRLPRDPAVMPNQAGTGGTWNFQQHPAFWFGMALCDNESAPEYTKTCTPTSDTNIKDGANPSQPDYIGYHAGTAYMEMQFYPPGWVPWEAGVSCDATQWCAALNIDSFSQNMNTGELNNNDCLNTAGVEPVGFAFITKNGHPQATVDPRTAFAPPFDQTTPDLSKDLLMNPGDVIKLSMHDSGEGFRVDITDVTTHQHGAMVAGAANGWNHVLFEPNSSTCHVAPYSFHPMYATSSEHTRVPWAAHTYNVAFSDEIGHFEYCNLADENGNCIDTGNATDPARDGDDIACFNPDDSLLVAIGGCIFSDGDFDGTAYKLRSWPGNGFDSVAPDPVTFTSATFNGGKNYDRVAFEADLPRIEGPPCNRRAPGAPGCTNPPAGAEFYPFFSTNDGSALAGGPPGNGQDPSCVWTEGGPSYPGTTNNFGGSSATEFTTNAPTLWYPGPGFQPIFRWNDYRNVLSNNPCPN